ncbi:MAG: hypothetical protein WA902_10755 [Thermosynechococcaceae cyanobacterium]
MPKGNPNPVITPEFKAKQFKREDGNAEPLSDKLTCVRLTQNVEVALKQLPNKSVWLRKVITEAAQRELMGGEG